MLFALALLMADPTATSPQFPQDSATTTALRSDTPAVDGAVPLDWAGPGARTPGADAQVQEFNPEVTLFGPSNMCVATKGQPLPACATKAEETLTLANDVFAGSGHSDTTCQTIETTRLGSNGKPQRVFATVCGDEAEAWSYKQRSTPASRANPVRPTGRVLGPNEISPLRAPN